MLFAGILLAAAGLTVAARALFCPGGARRARVVLGAGLLLAGAAFVLLRGEKHRIFLPCALLALLGGAMLALSTTPECKSRGCAVGVGAAFLLGGVAAAVLLLLRLEQALMVLGGVAVGGVLLAVGIYSTTQALRCTQAVPGVCRGFVERGKESRRGIFPVFEYEYQGQRLTEECEQCYGRGWMARRFAEGEPYTVYVNPREPRCFLLRRGPRAHHIAMLLLGAAFAVSPIILLVR